MKKTLLFAFASCLTFLLASCGGGSAPSEKISIEFYEPTSYVEQFDFTTLEYKATGIDGDIIWTSSNNEIAMVNNLGVVEGITPGTCSITASYKEVSATCSLVVTETSYAATLYLETDNVCVSTDEEYYFSCYVTFKGEVVDATSLKVDFLNENPSDVASVTYSAKEKTITVKGLKAGETVATISGTVKATYLCSNINIVVL